MNYNNTYNEDKTIWYDTPKKHYDVHQDEAGNNYIIEGNSGWKRFLDIPKCQPDIMEHLVVPKRANKEIQWHGLDNPKMTKQDADIFENWPNGDKINYRFNSRGFRDEEWPATYSGMKDAIWMIGDSFTMGMGIEYEESYKKKMEEVTGRRVIDISLDGTNPGWRRRIALKIMREVAPDYLIMHWGYIWRYKRKYRTLAQEVRNTIFQEQEESCMESFVETFKSLWETDTNTKVLHNFLPKFAGKWKSQEWIKHQIQDFTGDENPSICWDNEQLDTGRDGWHWGPETIQKYVENNLKLMQIKVDK